MEILPLSEELLEDFAELFSEFYTELRRKQGLKANPEKYREEALKYATRDLIFLAYEGKALGFIRISCREGCYWIEEIYVRPEARRRGIAKTLVRRAEEEVAKRDSYLYLYVLPQDSDAISFWKKMGYEIVNSIELVKPLKGEEETWPTLMDFSPFKIWKWPSQSYDELLIRYSLEKFLSEGSEELLKRLIPSSLLNYLKIKEEMEVREKCHEILAKEAEGKVLEVGCGLGRLCYLLAKNSEVKEVVGIEEREEVVEVVKRAFKALSIDKVRIIHGNFLEFPFQEKFDVVIFSFVLHDFDPEGFLERALEVLSPRGRILIAEPDLKGLRGRIKSWASNKKLEVKFHEMTRVHSHGQLVPVFLATISTG